EYGVGSQVPGSRVSGREHPLDVRGIILEELGEKRFELLRLLGCRGEFAIELSQDRCRRSLLPEGLAMLNLLCPCGVLLWRENLFHRIVPDRHATGDGASVVLVALHSLKPLTDLLRIQITEL